MLREKNVAFFVNYFFLGTLSCLVIAEIVNKLDRNSFALDSFCFLCRRFVVFFCEIILRFYIDFIRFLWCDERKKTFRALKLKLKGFVSVSNLNLPSLIKKNQHFVILKLNLSWELSRHHLNLESHSTMNECFKKQKKIKVSHPACSWTQKTSFPLAINDSRRTSYLSPFFPPILLFSRIRKSFEKKSTDVLETKNYKMKKFSVIKN